MYVILSTTSATTGGSSGERAADPGTFQGRVPFCLHREWAACCSCAPRSTGSGQAVLRTGHPVVRRMILDCLRHWALEYRVDGFCVLDAENLAQVGRGTRAMRTASGSCITPKSLFHDLPVCLHPFGRTNSVPSLITQRWLRTSLLTRS